MTISRNVWARAQDSRRQRPVTSIALQHEVARIVGSRVFSGGWVGRPHARRRFGASTVHVDLLARLIGEGQGGGAITVQEFAAHLQKSTQWVYITLDRLTQRLQDYYHFEGGNNPLRIAVVVQRGMIRVTADHASKAPADFEYERALYHMNRHTPDHVRMSLEHIQAALAAEPTHAPSHALMAETLLMRATHAFAESPAPLLIQAQRSADLALRHGPDFWRAHAAVGAVREWDFDFDGAREAFDQALRLDPYGLWDFEPYYGHLVSSVSVDHAVALAEALHRDRPADPIALRLYAVCLHIAGRDAEAESILLDTLRLEPDLWVASISLSLVYLSMDRADEAVAVMEPLVAAEPAAAWPGFFVVCLYAAGQTRRARTEFNALVSRAATEYVQPLQLALAHMGAGMLPDAVRYLRTACLERHPILDWVHQWPLFEPLRSETSFSDLLVELAIPPDVARRAAV